MTKNDKPVSRQTFMEELRRYQKGSVTRRHFLGVTGLGAATAVLAGAIPGLLPTRSWAGDIGDRVSIATWPNYQDPDNLAAFQKATGAAVQVNVFGSNEEMFAKLQAGGAGWDIVVATNYAISTYADSKMIEPLDLTKIPNYNAESFEARFATPGTVDGKLYGIPKLWGTTGMAWDSNKAKTPFTSWKDFFDRTKTDFSGRTIIHDYQLTAIGNALKYYGYSFNSVDPKELADAEKLLIEVKPHLFAITSDYQPSMRNGDAWLTMCWTGDAKQMNRDLPEIQYTLGKEGGEIWSDFYTIPTSAPNREGAYALLNFLLDPSVNAREELFHGYPVPDARVEALVPEEMRNDPILHPAAELLSTLEFGAAVTLTDPNRAELIARFKSA
ncbi:MULTISPECIES: ABC transporter substrate-binding protein [Brucella/Ochrobactrum group]|uniref:Extracellular solute-binding protein family 1 n=1 Tax=Brucella anthropi (strain ATCC 49188 / DSM 6882 / CCUG 24695 / JCM 21032 / LMG 3331 / NBRC 15819 / NCTC 12168 / Alc 37) TaxID=439375 RepID=A6X8G9_BRUA4|nr:MULTISPECIES: spermidine/putrescine ABC transporter substrate-binding protein [Brucella/Ochrobactrum group]ABS17523.1 extracellular solute-binding protein family 1 [Brucella anthropi ATCC 49188]AIK42297.1 Tat (twin-arginine translocation) pathway signal sequence domain protein [Brucella anthropi]KAB2727859.1 spermidine/putrescine ABC transporter substrate-binding protein [Brucella anthropi]KAB2746337.1 spermidine/putrescine ABC transporter substrate-binding protein [Brucella anthropi]KAB276